MNKTADSKYEKQAAAAFTKQSTVFDEIYSRNTIIRYKRTRVRDHVQQFINRNSSILELNAGTGEDAIYFAQQGHYIHATDISEGMLAKLSEKVRVNHLENNITHELCSFTTLAQLKQKGPYDLIFSNFAGLNCTKQLHKVLQTFSPLLKENGIITLVILPKFCLWETLLFFKGKFKTAFRRFFSSNGKKAHIEGMHFRCWYYSPSFIKKHTKQEFEVIATEGLCTIVPPSYIENFAEKHQKLFAFLKKLEEKWKCKWPWRSIGDYYIISLKKRKANQDTVAIDF
ncbi:MAG TPA: class I SAM-dependent methyltransferase [Chitinophagaceae bacterium]|jgi:ubiquinone/menaquinone biosynthesis C-methylase UbiE|nr:class I SAM-dependent methyltransferase [Chitinophagaceae bacterium]